MKIFNKENGVEKVYIQLDDLLVLFKTEQFIPISIFDKVFGKGIIIDNSNRYEFLEFHKKEEVDFFKAIDWIVDGKKLNKKDINELDSIYKESIKEINCFLIDRNNSLLSEDDNYEYELLKHKSNSIRNFFRTKYGNLKMPFPEVANSEGLIIDDSAKSGIILSESLNPNSIVMTKLTGEKFKGTDPINNHLINQALKIMKKRRKCRDESVFEYKTSYDISENLKSFIINYRKGKCETEIQEQIVLNRNNKMKKLLKKLLKKRDD